MLLALALACAPDPAAQILPDPGPPLDPDVATWWPAEVPFDTATRVMFFGDSITWGYGISNSENRYTSLLIENNDDRWPDFEGDTLTDRYGPLEVLDYSVNGAVTREVRYNQIPYMESTLPDVIEGHTLVFMTIGGNDLAATLYGQSDLDEVAGEVDDNLRGIAESFADPARYPDGATLFLSNVYEPTDGEGQADACFLGLNVSALEPVLDEINTNSLALAHEFGFAWIDLRGHFRGHGFNHDNPSIEAYDEEDPSLWLQDDCIHPNARGHHELRRLFLAAVDGVDLPL